MKKILYIENVASINAMSFYKSAALAAQQCGFEFHLAYNAFDVNHEKVERLLKEFGVHFHQIDFIRAPYDIRNIKAYKQVCHLINREGIEYIHCNTPIGGVVGRVAGKKCKCKKIIYQAHGFHFYRGASIFNWLIYYPIEKALARITDTIITINEEDFQQAQKFKTRGKKSVYKVSGVGISNNCGEYSIKKREQTRKEMNLKEDEIAIISMGDLIERKNYEIALEAVAKCNNKRIHYFVCGEGRLRSKLEKMVYGFGLTNQVHLLGYRADINELLNACDIFMLSSKQEGLSRSLMEAMVWGLPCIASNIRGNIDLLKNKDGNYLCTTVEEYSKAIEGLLLKEKREAIGNANKQRIKEYSVQEVVEELNEIYKSVLVD